MPKPLIVFPDPIEVGLRVLRDGFASHPEIVGSGLTISRTMPARTADTVAPALRVADDGDAGTGYWPVSEDAVLRVTVWDASAYRASRFARLARAHLLAYSGDVASRGFTAGTRPFPSEDPDDATPLASFTITARLRAG